MGETAQQVANFIGHVAQGDRSPQVSPGPQADRGAPAAPRVVDPLSQFAEKEATGHLLVELTQNVVILQEVPQTRTVLQQQTHKLRLIASQGREDGPVQVTGLDGKKPVEHTKLG